MQAPLHFTICLISLITVGLTIVGATEEDALMQLKKGFGSPSTLASWNRTISGSPCSGRWTGIKCGTNNTSVVRLSLRKLNLTGGHLSSSIGDLPNLQYIDLSENGLNGSIPSEISKLTSLQVLDLSKNELTGSLPEVWSNLTVLANLTLEDNRLNGPIPISLSHAKSLIRLRLANNQFNGSIPSEIFDQRSLRLRFLAIQFNNISGKIPEDIGECVSLRSFYAANNSLSGPIPDSIGNLNNLVHFEVEDNELSGALPESMNNLTDSLTSFNVSNNRLSGKIPAILYAKFNDSSFLGYASPCVSPSGQCSAQAPSTPRSGYDRRESPNDRDVNHQHYNGSPSSSGKLIGGIVGGVAAALALLLLILFLCCKLKSYKSKDSSQVQNWFSPDIQANRRKGSYEVFHKGFQYTYEEIVANAGYFDTAHVVGKGRFATVYRSLLPDGTHMAVKVFKFADVSPTFEKEIEMLGFIKHKNVLHIKGFYTNPVEKAVFFDYLPTGSLYNLLHGQANLPNAPVLPDWTARHTIALGVAQAMAFLHRGCGYRILHRDLKSTNILLETDLAPRVSDHGIVHMVSGKTGDVVETEGYTAPEVLSSKKYTEKSDVYSYGVILMELITGQKAVSYVRERSMSLTSWVTRLHKERRGREVMDAVALKTCPLPEYIDKALDLAVLCVDADPNNRPSMAEIASVLEGLNSVASPLRSPEFRLDMPLLPSYK